MTKLSVEQIKTILPHREPFLMLDRVEDYVPGEFAKAVKSVSANEWFFLGHFAETKVMPGAPSPAPAPTSSCGPLWAMAARPTDTRRMTDSGTSS